MEEIRYTNDCRREGEWNCGWKSGKATVYHYPILDGSYAQIINEKYENN